MLFSAGFVLFTALKVAPFSSRRYVVLLLFKDFRVEGKKTCASLRWFRFIRGFEDNLVFEQETRCPALIQGVRVEGKKTKYYIYL